MTRPLTDNRGGNKNPLPVLLARTTRSLFGGEPGLRERVALVGGEPEEADGLFVVFYEAAEAVRVERGRVDIVPSPAAILKVARGLVTTRFFGF